MAGLPNDIALAGKYHFVLEDKSVKNFVPQKRTNVPKSTKNLGLNCAKGRFD